MRNVPSITSLSCPMSEITGTHHYSALDSGSELGVNGGVVIGATVTVTNPDTGTSKTTVTSDTGFYRVSALVPMLNLPPFQTGGQSNTDFTNSGDFGRALSGQAGRVIEFQIRLSF